MLLCGAGELCQHSVLNLDTNILSSLLLTDQDARSFRS